MTTDQQQNINASTSTLDHKEIDYSEDEMTPEEKKQQRKKVIKFVLDQVLAMVIMLTIDVGIPLGLYYATRDKVGYVVALVIGGIPPFLHVLYKFWKKRTLDIVGCIFVASFIGSAILSLITGDARIALFRDATVDILIAFIFLVTLLPIHTRWVNLQPLCYLITAQMLSEAPPMKWVTEKESGEPEEHSQPMAEWMWEQVSFFRKFCYILTILWGVVMLTDFTIKAVLILGTTMSIDQLVVVNNILQIVITVVMTSGSMIACGFMHKHVSARMKEWKKTHVTPEKYAKKTIPLTTTEEV
ncbi:uncharacterized protein BX664DRAFT_263721 [Halteromyces radiatus]|uniref:uncharacterized protein n=1 Tax=Halteromyces radiatus TaxID=101107 RepID=UPI002220BE75|nr:uncharacterized protein BX664DRAFT_263721 [Halteromyces radiatus]KAI8089462.1 hypothetical protein BX664DRAFT_263721 [Halteromyces radiatus]